jgi:uncharacterized protein YqgQ
VVIKIKFPTKLALAPETQYEVIVSELERLLGKGFVDSNRWLRASLDRIKDLHKQDQPVLKDYEMSIIAMLVKDLQEIEEYDVSLLKKFKNNLYESVGIDEYFGVRFEINIAASLIRNGIKFLKTESPDFTIQMETKSIYVECGSSHLSKPKSVDLKYKIVSEIREKAKKKYCNPDTALFIDATNIFHSTPKEILITPSQFQIRTHIKETLEATNFGNVTVFSYLLNKDRNRFESNYQRTDHKNISKPLKQFLNKFYPIGEVIVFNFEVPSHG